MSWDVLVDLKVIQSGLARVSNSQLFHNSNNIKAHPFPRQVTETILQENKMDLLCVTTIGTSILVVKTPRGLLLWVNANWFSPVEVFVCFFTQNVDLQD